MARQATIRVARRVQATTFRNHYRRLAAGATGKSVVLIENRRQKPKYLVDKQFLDRLVQEQESVRATLEILADPKLTERLLKLGKTVDKDVRAGRRKVYSMREVFGET